MGFFQKTRELFNKQTNTVLELWSPVCTMISLSVRSYESCRAVYSYHIVQWCNISIPWFKLLKKKVPCCVQPFEISAYWSKITSLSSVGSAIGTERDLMIKMIMIHNTEKNLLKWFGLKIGTRIHIVFHTLILWVSSKDFGFIIFPAAYAK